LYTLVNNVNSNLEVNAQFFSSYNQWWREGSFVGLGTRGFFEMGGWVVIAR